MTRTRPAILAVLVILATALAVGCGAGPSDDGSSSNGASDPSGSGNAEGAGGSGGATLAAGAAASAATEATRRAHDSATIGATTGDAAVPIPSLDDATAARARELIDRCGDRDVTVALQAERELIELGAGVVPLLIRSYRDDDQRRRVHIVRALGAIGHPRAIRYLRDALKDPWLAVRIEAAQSLEPLLQPDDEFTATELISVIKNDTEPIVKAYAAKALLTVDNMMGIPLLVGNLERKLWPREVSVEALRDYTGENFGFEPYANATLRKAPADAWDRWYRSHTPLHENMIEYLGVYKFLFAETAKQWLIQIGRDASNAVMRGLGHDNEHVRAHCAEILGVVEEPRAVASLVEALADSNPMVRLQSAIALGKIGDTSAGTALLRSAGDSDRDVRAASIMALGKLRNDELEAAAALNESPGDLAELARLFALFSSASVDAKVAAARRILANGSPLSLPWLIAHRSADGAAAALRSLESLQVEAPFPPAADADDGTARRWLADVLVDVMPAVRTRLDAYRTLLIELDGDADVIGWAARSIPAFVAILDAPDSTEHHRFLVTELLGIIGSRQGTQALAKRVVVDPSIMVREAAGHALAKIKDPAAAEALEKALDDRERYVVSAAIRALADCGRPESIGPLMRTRARSLADPDLVDTITATVQAIDARY